MVGVYNIPSGYPFLDSLASGLLQKASADPFQLCQMEVFLPTRRACSELQQAFLRQSKGNCLLLPKLSPLGDLDEGEAWLPTSPDENSFLPLISPFKRLGLLTSLIQRFTKKTSLPLSPILSLKLAKSLLRLMDQATIENVPWEGLLHLVPSEFASHWQLTLNFLEIITTHWPKIIEEYELVEPYQRHHQTIEARIASWKAQPPSHIIVAAGSTGTMPATAELLKVIASLSQGAVILPGFDPNLNSDERKALSPCHPQYTLTMLLNKLEVQPSDIQLWEGRFSQHPRARLFSEAMKTYLARERHTNTFPFEQALENVHYIPCATPQEEALAIAILIRQQLEITDQRIALITSDLKLAERVRWELKRWSIEIDRSSGEALEQTPAAVFLNLCAEFSANPADPIGLLCLLKHPLFRMDEAPSNYRSEIKKFEINVLRGNSYEIPTWIQTCLDRARQLLSHKALSFQDALTLHRELAECLTRDQEDGCHLWKGPKGKAVKDFMDSLIDVAADFPSVSFEDYPLLFKELLKGQVLRFTPRKHPRLTILGPLEARLFHADVVILGGLNEGKWPPSVDIDPWLNRPMREDMGFPSPERRIGLSAHDFGQAFANPKVYLTRALKVDGTQTIACRWLERIEVYLKIWDLSLPKESKLLEWAKQLDVPEAQLTSTPPMPRPPLESRPRRLSVTQIETWMRDPYALYAKHILSLSPLNPLNVELQASDKGTLIHKALDQFFQMCPNPWDKNALEILRFIGRSLFEPIQDDPIVRLFWKPRFDRLARWFIDYERTTRLPGTQTFTEIKGSLSIKTKAGLFTCTAKADRIDILPNGNLRILDYKTGMPPSDQDVNLGFAPQLPLEAAIAMAKGFEGISASHVESLEFWWLKGDLQGGLVKKLPGCPEELAAQAKKGLENLIRLYEKEETSYPACPLPLKGLKYNDYAQLARIQEWGRR